MRHRGPHGNLLLSGLQCALPSIEYSLLQPRSALIRRFVVRHRNNFIAATTVPYSWMTMLEPRTSEGALLLALSIFRAGGFGR